MPQRHEIERRAYEKFEARGCEHGHDCDDWLEAERELTSGGTGRAAEETSPGRSTLHEQPMRGSEPAPERNRAQQMSRERGSAGSRDSEANSESRSSAVPRQPA